MDDHKGVDRRTLLRWSGLTAAGALLAACSSTSSGGATTSASNSSAAVTGSSGLPTGGASSSAAAIGTAGSSGSSTSSALSGQVVVSTANTVPKSAQQALAAAYKKVQPGVSVVWEQPGSDNYVSWLETQLAAGDIRPDVVTGYVNSNKYIDFQAWENRTNPYLGAPWSQGLTFKGNVDASGKLIQIGTRNVTVPIIYNKDQFEKAGISAAPATWDELLDACEKLKSKGFKPFSANATLDVGQWMKEVYFDQYHADWVATVRAQKGDWDYDPTKDGAFSFDAQAPDLHDRYTFNLQRYYAGIKAGKLRFDTPQVQAMITNTAQIFPKYAQADFVLPNDPYPGFLAAKGAMLANTPGAFIALAKDMKKSGQSFAFDSFPFPSMTGSLVTTSKTRAVEATSGDYVSVIGKTAQQTAVVMDFLEFWLSKAGYGAYLQGAAQDPTWAGPDGPLLIKGVQDPAPYTNAFANLPSRGNAEASYNILFLNWGNGNGNFRTESQAIYLSALQGKTTPAAAATAIQAYVEKNFNAILKAHQLTADHIANPARQPGS